MEPSRTRDIANLGRTLTKDTTDRDTLRDRRMDDLLMLTNRQIEPSIACSRYPHIKSSSSSSSNRHTQTWIAHRLYCSTLSSQLETRTSTCTHSSATNSQHTDSPRTYLPGHIRSWESLAPSFHSVSVIQCHITCTRVPKTFLHDFSYYQIS